VLASGIILPPTGIFLPSTLMREDATKLARAEKALQEQRVGQLWNQISYGHPERAGEFYGYSGAGYTSPMSWSGTMVTTKGGYPFVGGAKFTDPVWRVPFQQARVKVWLVNEESGGPEKTPEETLRTGTFDEELQENFLAVPMPTLALIPKERANSNGSDSNCIIWCPATDELWEFHRVSQFKKSYVGGPQAGEWKCGYGVYVPKASQWNGIRPENPGGELSASGLSHASGCISFTDLIKVARGEGIDHALNFSLPVTLNAHVAPAVTNDHQLNTYPYLENGENNPAYWTEGPEGKGSFDAIPEGTWYAFPAASNAAEHGLTRALEAAIYEAGRKHGFYVSDSSGGAGLQLEDAVTLFTPYSAYCNPLQGSKYFSKYVGGEESGEKKVATALREAWTDPTIAAFTGELNGTEGVLQSIPWRNLELLAPRSS
jgi:hypothetical protein